MNPLHDIMAIVVAPKGALAETISQVLAHQGADVSLAESAAEGGTPTAVVFVAGTPAEYGIAPDDVTRYLGEVVGRARAAAQAVVAGEDRDRSVVFVAPSLGATFAAGATSISAAIGALQGLSRAVAVELGDHGVRSNVVLPGVYESDLAEGDVAPPTPLRRDGSGFTRHRDVALAAAYLTSRDALAVSGAEIAVDGGLAEHRQSLSSVLWTEGHLTPERGVRDVVGSSS